MEIAILLCLFFCVVVIEFISYTFLIPDISQKPLHISSLDIYVGRTAYGIAYVLSLLRAPLGLLPYIMKLFIFFGLGIRYESAQSTYWREAINMLGDVVNLGLTTVLVEVIVGPPRWQWLVVFLYIPVAAELVRVLVERVLIVWSALWQLLPHRKVARAILAREHKSIVWGWVARGFARYCRYYALSDAERMAYVLCVLKRRAALDKVLSERLDYVQALRIIPQEHGLRSGYVRDVARGEVFIHGVWTNDPWLLTGMAIRRAPWMFDPRYMRRPFYYMTEANVLATLLVLEHARYCLPYAIFQFGHEIRVARLHCFYSLLRWLRMDVEYKVSADGTFQFDQLIDWLGSRYVQKWAKTKRRDLYTDEEVIAEVAGKDDAEIDKMGVAIRYTYPLKYVEEVLWGKIPVVSLQAVQIVKGKEYE